MYLKNITLRGFKSFKDKSQLFFEPGISVIVGPNGSGKSNVADAISWVLGEQSPRTLRGNSMADVIFRNKNEEMGIAEVSLLFDNSNKVFDTEFRDVKITRRVYTRGGSDYFINSSPCRLVDIQELIADSGIGKGLHIIINQGQINEIALLKPAERKAVIEEILGISKHKNRRDKSLAKLEKVKNDIDRINDLIGEIKITMDPLEIEAARAQKYSEIFNLLKNEEISLFIASLNNLNIEWERENDFYKKTNDELEKVKNEISNILNKKNELLKLTDGERSDFELWREKIDRFNIESNNIKNIIALIESKQNVFRTLKNMFSIDYTGYKASEKKSKEVVGNEDSRDDNIIPLLEEITCKLEKIVSLLIKFLDNTKKKVQDFKTVNYIEGEISLITREVEKISEMVEKRKKRMLDIPLDTAISGEAIKVDKKNDSDDKEKLNKIESLKEICVTNLVRANKMNLILKRFLPISENIKKELYCEFEKKNKSVIENQKKKSELESQIENLNQRKIKLESDLYKSVIKKEQIKEKVETITENIVDNYGESVEYILKSYNPSTDVNQSENKVKKLKNEIKKYGNINPNAAIEYKKIKKRFDFLSEQKRDLVEGKKELEELIDNINRRISDDFNKKFVEINKCFRKYFKILFPLGEGEMQLEKSNEGSYDDYDNIGVDLKVDIGNNKFVNLSLLSGGEKTLVSIAFLFSIYSINPSPFYVFDEVDASLDDVNISRFLTLIKNFSEKQQIILITHQKKTMEIADTIYGVTMQPQGISKVICEKIRENNAEINQEYKLSLE
ncbi:MAG: chromosome segregation SMC family protein [Actinomycetota bacterium]|nr:chromosome segregation SMC family protein [Actinomycetota bacterium]